MKSAYNSARRVLQDTAPSGAENARPPAGVDARQGQVEALLETSAKSVRHPIKKTQTNKGKSSGRSNRFRWQRHAAKLTKGGHRVGLCRWSVISKSEGVDLVLSRYVETGESVAHYEGLQSCGSVWACPCCGARISETRRDELNRLLAWARRSGLRVHMLTLTARHGRDDDLADLLMRMKDAKQRWARHRSYRDIKPFMLGSVTATEVTAGGAHGWHPHFHVIVVTEGDVDLLPLRDAWLASLRGVGLEGTGAGWDIRDASETGEYVAKWGAAEELALSGHKKGRHGRTPNQLLAASCDQQDAEAGKLWQRYVEVFHGKRQLVWSRGLKSMVGIGEIQDEEAAKDTLQDDQEEIGRANIETDIWNRCVATRKVDGRHELLAHAESVGAVEAVDGLLSGTVAEVFDEFNDLFEVTGPKFTPQPGGLIEQALAAVRRPPMPPNFGDNHSAQASQRSFDSVT